MNSKNRVTKVYRNGTHRVISPKNTVEKIKPFMARMGITRIANVTGLDRTGIPVIYGQSSAFQGRRPNLISIISPKF